MKDSSALSSIGYLDKHHHQHHHHSPHLSSIGWTSSSAPSSFSSSQAFFTQEQTSYSLPLPPSANVCELCAGERVSKMLISDTDERSKRDNISATSHGRSLVSRVGTRKFHLEGEGVGKSIKNIFIENNIKWMKLILQTNTYEIKNLHN